MKNLILLICFCCPFIVLSQTEKCGCKWNTIVAQGIAAGESKAAFLLQGSTGYSFGKWFTGVGAGIDFYRFKSFPLYADLRLSFDKAQKVFAYTNAGYAIPFGNKNDVDEWNQATTDQFRGGFYLDAGLGYKIKTGALRRLFVSAGFNSRQISNKVGYVYPCLIPPCLETFYTYKYTLGTINAKLGWIFGK